MCGRTNSDPRVLTVVPSDVFHRAVRAGADQVAGCRDVDAGDAERRVEVPARVEQGGEFGVQVERGRIPDADAAVAVARDDGVVQVVEGQGGDAAVVRLVDVGDRLRRGPAQVEHVEVTGGVPSDELLASADVRQRGDAPLSSLPTCEPVDEGLPWRQEQVPETDVRDGLVLGRPTGCDPTPSSTR